MVINGRTTVKRTLLGSLNLMTKQIDKWAKQLSQMACLGRAGVLRIWRPCTLQAKSHGHPTTDLLDERFSWFLADYLERRKQMVFIWDNIVMW